VRERTSKIVIDATRQLPDEGGPEIYSEFSRHVLTRHDPQIFDRIDAKWAEIIARGPAV
jgi:3-polyprenyl-4-hydroxybenzoate decarboxylase